MKIFRILVSFSILFVSGFMAHAITNTVIAVSGTNLVLSWPSHGYETYLVQYRQTLAATDSWSIFTNAYPANSTNRTTLTLSGLGPAPIGGGGSGSIAGQPPSPSFASRSTTTTGSGPLVRPANESGSGVPLALYPPGTDLSGDVIYDPATGESVSGDGYVVKQSTANGTLNGATPTDPGASDGAVSTGFYRAFHIPDWLADVSNYAFDGPTFIPVDFAAPDAPVDYVDNTTVLINGQPTDDSVFMPYVINGVTNWGVGVYFDRLPNGTNTIQLLTAVRQSDMLNAETPYMVFSNAPATIAISNFVTYINWADFIFSNSYTFHAQSTTPNVGWGIDIYDVYGNFVNSQTGYSTNGDISWTWNLTDYTGASRLDDSDPFFYPYITITNSSGDPGGWTPPVANQFPDEGAWLFAYLDNFYDDGTTNYAGDDNYFTNGINALSGGPLEWGINTWLAPLEFGHIYSQTNRDESWNSLRDDLQGWDARNFYYFGHGAADIIGGDISVLDNSNNIIAGKILPGSQAYLTSKWVHDNVTYNKSWGGMPFRFVFLDGCDTANGGWPAAWGVPTQTEPLSYYQSTNNISHTRPSAFVGWNTEVGGAGWGSVYSQWQFRQDWMAEWAGTSYETLQSSFTDAITASGWISQGQLNAHLVVDGYNQMGFFQYNHSGDWP